MKTVHRIVFGDSGQVMDAWPSRVHLVLTSPPYPMIEMWDGTFAAQNKEIGEALKRREGGLAFELMHRELDEVWRCIYRILHPGGIACVNVGDATRTVDGSFQLYSNHARVLACCRALGFLSLPEILWRKQSSKPNKFMGSGMLPPGAYVTQEHEYILVLRRERTRDFSTVAEKMKRRRSAFFWEERNKWFSDIWDDLKGDKQEMKGKASRERSAAFPLELCYRIISMFSVQGDTVIDPFMGTGTTVLAAMVTGRNSVGIEVDRALESVIESRLTGIEDLSREYRRLRIERHLEFVERMKREGRELRYRSEHYGFPVMTRQETGLRIPAVRDVRRTGRGLFEVTYED